ncbi:hypothetical protein LJC59_07685 [Desulfovibrio sp. OttesenSCG-928-A18]|nr:hypothetical protein [Desulfovibrio sp. OttesenSCG-928-A18]
MQSPRTLISTLVISLCLSLGLLQFAPAAAPASFTLGFRHLVLIPFGGLCTLLSGGCLLHDVLQRRGQSGARLLQCAGMVLFALTAGILIWARIS